MFEGLAPEIVETLQWVLAQIRSRVADKDAHQTARFVSPAWRHPERAMDNLLARSTRLGDFEVVGATRVDDEVMAIDLRCARGRAWIARVGLDEQARMTRSSILRPLPDGVCVRPVSDADWDALTELEAACPTKNAEGGSAFIHRRHLREHFDLQGEYELWLAEHNGRIIGARAFTVREFMIGRRNLRFAYSHFARILPAYQSQGIFQPLNALAGEAVLSTTDGFFAYMDPGNDAMRTALGGFPSWSVHVQRAALPCKRLAGPAFGRRATPRDADHIADLINACHRGEGFFAPYTVEMLTQRLHRVPHAYAWNDVLVSDRAVAGVWLAGEHRRIERDGVVAESVRGLVLDYGFDGAQGLEELERLLRYWCAIAHEAGITHLAIFSSPSSPGAKRLLSLADGEQIESFEFPCGVPEPRNLTEAGVYVDAIYF